MAAFKKIFIAIFLLFSINTPAYPDEVRLKNGNVMKGVITAESEDSVTLNVDIGSFTILRSDIASIEKDAPEKNEQLRQEWEQRKKLEEARKKVAIDETKQGTAKTPTNEPSKKPKDNEEYSFESSEAAFKSYMKACKALDFGKSDLCYTEEFRNFIKTNKRYLTHRHTGQLANAYRYWHDKPYKLELHGNKAIMRFSPEFSRPEPFYFVKERGEWKIDGMFSFKNVIIEDGRSWHWKNPKIDNEKVWLRK